MNYKFPVHLIALVSASVFLSSCAGLEEKSAISGSDSPLVAQWMEKGEKLESDGNLSEAMNMYEKAVELSQESIAPHLALAGVLRKQKRAAEAVPLLEEARSREPKNYNVLTEFGFAKIAANEPQQAIAFFDEAIGIDPAVASAYSGKGVALDLMAEHTVAQEVYREAIARGIDSSALTNNYALSLILSGNSKDAVAMLEPIVKSDMATPTIRQNLALAYGLRGNSAKALGYGLKDLSPEQARENLEFYKRVSEIKETNTSVAKKDSVKKSHVESEEPSHQAVPVAKVTSRDAERFDTTNVKIKEAKKTEAQPAKEEKKEVEKKEAAKKEVLKTNAPVSEKKASAEVKPEVKKPEEQKPTKKLSDEEIINSTDGDIEFPDDGEASAVAKKTAVKTSEKGFFDRLSDWEPDQEK